MSERVWDFGFSLEDEDFVPPAKAEKIEADQKKLEEVVNMVLPLLNNLMKSPEKPTIYWPNRVEKVTAFKLALLEVAGMEIND